MLLIQYSFSQSIYSGPMVGYSSFREVMVWVQLDKVASVKMKYWTSNSTDTLISAAIVTNEESDYTAHLIAKNLIPNSQYHYEILIDEKMVKPTYEQIFNTLTIWKHRTDAPDFDFVTGSCFYINEEYYDRPGSPYGGDYQIINSIYNDKPDFMLWLGDNTYLREADWDSRSGVYHRYRHTRHLKELQPLLANTHHYAIWDDHDYGPNDSDYTYSGKLWTRSAFNHYWANPEFYQEEIDGITNYFSWNDADFFLLDNRWYKSPPSISGTILGKTQLKWLIDALRFSNAKFKFVCIGGQFLNSVREFENYANYADERNEIIDAINKYKINGVIFLTGDRHHSEISHLETIDGIDIYDITASPLTSGAHPHPNENNINRISGSMIGERNYALLKVYGDSKNRKLLVTYKNSDGKVLFQYEIK
jgi:alkaline phosphatase D